MYIVDQLINYLQLPIRGILEYTRTKGSISAWIGLYVIAVIQYIKITIINVATVETILLLSDELFIIKQTQREAKLQMVYFSYPFFQ